ESRLQSMLEGIVGRGKAIVRVATKIDFTQVEKTEEKYDPDTTAVRSEQRTQEKSSGSVMGGVPGVLSNQPGQQPSAAAGTPSSSQKQSENINYEISRSVSKIVQPRGEVKSVSVAVLVDGIYKKEKGKKVYVPRSEDELKKYTEAVKASIGFNQERGDQVIVQNMPFETGIEEIPEKTDWLRLIVTVLKYLVPIAAVVLLILFVIKPVIEALKAPVEMLPSPVADTGMRPLQEITEEEASPEELMKDKVMDVVRKDPRRAASILREWLSE
ncbi:MAG TPA: flagellar M-ring protein FliF C-terminal domain-containing protein, partial [Dissulfurispiraceae bacterium]